MSNSIKIVLTISLMGFVAACGQQEEVVDTYIPSITVEPPHTGKYK